MAEDPKFRYFLQCREQQVGVLPIMQKVKNKILNLSGYGISAGLAKSIGQSIKKNDNFLSRIILENNGLKDEDFAAMLEGLGRLQDIKSIIYIKNEFGMKCVDIINPMLTFRTIPYHLEELRLVSCKIHAQALNGFLDIL